MQISFRQAFAALSTQTAIAQSLAGVDSYRRPLPAGHDFGCPVPASERVSPLSKLRHTFSGDEDSVWHTLHFKLINPAIWDLSRRAKEAKLSDLKFNHEEASKYIRAFPDLRAHLQQLHVWRNRTEPILENLREDPEMLSPELASLLAAEIPEVPANHIVGRLLQTYYAVQTGDFARFGIPVESENYFDEEGAEERNNMHVRMRAYVLEELQKCPLPTDDKGQIVDEISGMDILEFYRWLASTRVVEFVLPDFQGAAEVVANDLVAFLDDISDTIDLRSFTVREKMQKELRADEDLLRRVGMMEQRFEKVPVDLRREGPSGALTYLAKQIWPEAQRIRVWGDAERLVLDCGQTEQVQHCRLSG
ncbi:MAG: hypothetical protein AAGB32_02855 [Pseudomonadota bacterium]